MSTIFVGEPPPEIKSFIVERYATPSGQAGHAETWYKYAGDTSWRTVGINGTIDGDINNSTPTTQIPNVADMVAIEIGTDVTGIGPAAFDSCS